MIDMMKMRMRMIPKRKKGMKGRDKDGDHEIFSVWIADKLTVGVFLPMLTHSFWNRTTNPPQINWQLQYNSTLILELDDKETTVSP